MKLLILFNSFSGKGYKDNIIDYLKDELKDKFEVIDVYQTEGEKSITEKITADGSNYDVVMTVGGDGTVNEAINGIMRLENKPRLAIIPHGTCNDIAKSTGNKRVKKAIKNIKNDLYVNLNVFKINNAFFAYGLATGGVSNISYKVSKKAKNVLGKNAYYINSIKTVFERNPKIKLSIDYDDNNHIEGRFYLMLAINTRYLAGVKVRGWKKTYNTSKLHVVLFKEQHRITGFLSFVLFVLFGYKNKNMVIFDAEHLKITPYERVEFNTDGEKFEPRRTLDITSISNELEVYCKKKIIRLEKKREKKTNKEKDTID